MFVLLFCCGVLLFVVWYCDILLTCLFCVYCGSVVVVFADLLACLQILVCFLLMVCCFAVLVVVLLVLVLAFCGLRFSCLALFGWVGIMVWFVGLRLRL